MSFPFPGPTCTYIFVCCKYIENVESNASFPFPGLRCTYIFTCCKYIENRGKVTSVFRLLDLHILTCCKYIEKRGK